MASPKVEAPAFLIMFLIVCTACIDKYLVEARKIEVIQQSNEPVYHIDYRGPRCNGCPEEKDELNTPSSHHYHPPNPPNNPEDKDEPVYHTDRCITKLPPSPNGSENKVDSCFHHSPPNSPEDLKLNYHTSSPKKDEVIPQSNESVYHTDYRGPRCNGCPEEKDELNSPSSHHYHPPIPPNSPEDKDKLVYHTDRGHTTLPPSPYSPEDKVHSYFRPPIPPSSSEDIDELVYHGGQGDYHDPICNGCPIPISPKGLI